VDVQLQALRRLAPRRGGAGLLRHGRLPPDRPVPRASIEFELAGADAVTEEAAELASGGFRLLHGARTEPWGQAVARLQTVEGLIVGLSHVPWLH
jgi:hypothetical protein